MAKVFISYSRKDIDFAKRLTAELQKSELDLWIDWEGIPPTVDWWREIEKGIEESDAFLFLISPDSAESKVCNQEIDHAVKNGKRLLPIVIRETDANEIHPKLKSLNWIFFRETNDFDASIKKLLTSIHTDFDWVEVQRRLQVRSLEWEHNNKEKSFHLRGVDLADAELQLATNTSKEPFPTDLQREYVFESRKAADRQRRNITTVSVIGIIILAALSVFSFIQRNIAIDNENARATSQVDAENNAATAIANEQEAIRQAQIALARQLASQATSNYTTLSSNQLNASLLAIQSMKLFPTSDAASFLINNNHSVPYMSNMLHDDGVLSVAFSPDGNFVISGSSDGTVHIWEAASGKEVARMTHDDSVYSVAFSSDGKYVVSGSWDGTARVWEAASGDEIARMTHRDELTRMTTHGSPLYSVAFSPDGKYVVSGSDDKTARVWEAATGNEVARMTHDFYVYSVAFSPDGKYVVSGGWDGTARVWETASGDEVARMTHDSSVDSVAFSPDGKYVVSGGWDDTARVWEAATGNEVARMTHDSNVSSVAFSPDGKYVVSGSLDKTARVWEAATGDGVARMTLNVYSAAFNPDGKYVVSGGGDGTARIWEADTGNEVARKTHDDIVYSVAFSPDGKYVVSGSADSSTRVWDWQPQDLITNACAVMPRNLTLAEWQQYVGVEVPYEVICDPEIYPNAIIPGDAQEYLDSQ